MSIKKFYDILIKEYMVVENQSESGVESTSGSSNKSISSIVGTIRMSSTMDSQIYLKKLSMNVRTKFSNVVKDEREMNSKFSIKNYKK